MNEKSRVYLQYRTSGALVDEGPPAGPATLGCTITLGSFGFPDDDADDCEGLILGPTDNILACFNIVLYSYQSNRWSVRQRYTSIYMYIYMKKRENSPDDPEGTVFERLEPDAITKA